MSNHSNLVTLLLCLYPWKFKLRCATIPANKNVTLNCKQGQVGGITRQWDMGPLKM